MLKLNTQELNKAEVMKIRLHPLILYNRNKCQIAADIKISMDKKINYLPQWKWTMKACSSWWRWHPLLCCSEPQEAPDIQWNALNLFISYAVLLYLWKNPKLNHVKTISPCPLYPHPGPPEFRSPFWSHNTIIKSLFLTLNSQPRWRHRYMSQLQHKKWCVNIINPSF